MKENRTHVLAAGCIIATGFCFVAGMYVVMLTYKMASEKDFIELGGWTAHAAQNKELNMHNVTTRMANFQRAHVESHLLLGRDDAHCLIAARRVTTWRVQSATETLHSLYSSPKPRTDFSDRLVSVVFAHAAVVPGIDRNANYRAPRPGERACVRARKAALMGFSVCRKFGTGIERQGLKPNLFSLFTARLKSCPDTKQDFSVASKVVP